MSKRGLKVLDALDALKKAVFKGEGKEKSFSQYMDDLENLDLTNIDAINQHIKDSKGRFNLPEDFDPMQLPYVDELGGYYCRERDNVYIDGVFICKRIAKARAELLKDGGAE